MEEQSPVAPPPPPSQPPRKARRLVPQSNRWNQGSVVMIVAAVLVVIAVVILPPIQIPTRISWIGCTEVSAKSPVATGPEGLTVSLADTAKPTGATLRLKMSSLAQEKLPAAAIKAIPASVTPLSPLYQTTVCGSTKLPVELNVSVSVDAASADSLDLMSWDGKNWQWVSGHADIPSGAMIAQLDSLPPNVMVVQTAPGAPMIGAEIPADATVSDRVTADVNEFTVPGFWVAEDGTLQGEPSSLPAPVDNSHAMFAIARSWSPNAPIDPAVIEDILANAKSRAAHVKALTDAAVKSNYTGIVVDYRDITSDSRADLSRFVAELAASLHQHQKQLVVVVPAPARSEEGDGWDTAGYDWKAIGSAADVVQLEAPTDPAAYGSSRRFEEILRWGIGEVNRARLQVALSTSSIKQTGNTFQLISYEEALKPFKAISTSVGLDQVVPGEQVKLSLGDTPGLQLDDASHMYHYTITASGGTPSIVWINTGAALAQKLSLPLRLGLRGVTLKGLDTSNEPGVWTALEQYQTQALAAVPSQLQIVWTVRGADGAQLSGGTAALTDTTFVWTAPDSAGRFTIAAALPGSATRDELTVNVEQPTPTPPPTATPTPAPEATATPTSTLSIVDKCPAAEFVADVTVPDGTQMDKNKEFTKTWKVRNAGSCDWSEGTVAAYAAGEKMGAPDIVKVGVVKSGDSVEISVPMKSPDKDGNFQATWRLMTDKGDLFGPSMTVVIVAGQPQVAAAASQAAASAAPAPVVGGAFELGGQVDSFAHPDKMHYAGMNWVKHQVRWSPGDNPGPIAGVIADAHNKGFKVLLSVLGGADEAKPTNFPSYAAFVGELAKLGPDAIEIWNEENLDREWQHGAINPATYTDLLRQAYSAIKAANPNVIVISGAPSPTGAEGAYGLEAVWNDDHYIGGMAAAGAANYMDCVGVHYNEGIVGPNQTSGDPRDDYYTRYFWGMVNKYYNTFGRKLCLTEMGYLSPEGYGKLPGGFAWAQNTTIAQQAQWLAEAASLAANSGKVRLIIIFNVDFTYWGDDPQAGYAIIRRGGDCPACETLHGVLGTR